MAVDLIKGTDRDFTLRIVKSSSQEPFNFSGILSLNAVALKLPTDSGTPMELTLAANANGSLLTITSQVGGKILVTLSDVDTALLKAADGQNMELTIKEDIGGGAQNISIVQFPGSLNVKKSLFE